MLVDLSDVALDEDVDAIYVGLRACAVALLLYGAELSRGLGSDRSGV
jgi:hypothetical protein